MTFTWFTLTVLALACYRATRLITEDTVTAGLRKWIELHATTKLANAQSTWLEVDKDAGWLWRRVYALSSCSWCVSIWTGGGIVALSHYQWSWFQFVCYALSLSTLAGWGTRIG